MSMQTLAQTLPVPLRVICCILVLNFCWLSFYTSKLLEPYHKNHEFHHHPMAAVVAPGRSLGSESGSRRIDLSAQQKENGKDDPNILLPERRPQQAAPIIIKTTSPLLKEEVAQKDPSSRLAKRAPNKEKKVNSDNSAKVERRKVEKAVEKNKNVLSPPQEEEDSGTFGSKRTAARRREAPKEDLAQKKDRRKERQTQHMPQEEEDSGTFAQLKEPADESHEEMKERFIAAAEAEDLAATRQRPGRRKKKSDKFSGREDDDLFSSGLLLPPEPVAEGVGREVAAAAAAAARGALAAERAHQLAAQHLLGARAGELPDPDSGSFVAPEISSRKNDDAPGVRGVRVPPRMQALPDQEGDEDNVLIVIISNRMDGIVPAIGSIVDSSSKPVDVVLIGNEDTDDKVREHFGSRINHVTSMTADDVEKDLLAHGYRPIWTWPEWGSSRRPDWKNKNTVHVANWDRLETHAHKLNHIRFYLPHLSIFKNKKFFYFLDDDILVKKDLGPIAKEVISKLDGRKGMVTPCNIWIWNSECHHFQFKNQEDTILDMPSLYGDRDVCKTFGEAHCVPAHYHDFVNWALPEGGKEQKAWNFGFSLFVLKNWRSLGLTEKYESIMKESYRLHVFPETSLTFGLGVPYLAFAGAVECWNEDIMKVRDGFGFIEWVRYEQTFGKDFFKEVDVIHYTGPEKPWAAETTIDERCLDPWFQAMKREKMTLPHELPPISSDNLFTLLAAERTGAHWIMSQLDMHPHVCASGEADRPESGFPADVLLPGGLPWFPECSLKRGCTFAYIRDAVLELTNNGKLSHPTRCTPSYQAKNDPLTLNLDRLCNFISKLKGDYSNAAMARVWVDAFSEEDKDVIACGCERGTLAKGVKVMSEWITYKGYPNENVGPPDIVLDDTKLSGRKVIRLKRRNLWARYKSMLLAQATDMYHPTTVEEKKSQLETAGDVTVSMADLTWRIQFMKDIDDAGDAWAKAHASEILELYYEDCRDDSLDCFRRLFDFLGVDKEYVEKHKGRFESEFASINLDGTLNNIANKGAVIEALGANGWTDFIDDKYQELQLLIYDETETIRKAHQAHQVRGVNAVIFGHEDKMSSKFAAAVPVLKVMQPDDLVVLSDNHDVRINYPSGGESARYEAIFGFRAAFEELTRNYPGAVVISANAECCVSALTHANPGDYFTTNGARKKRSCLSGEPGCMWTGAERAQPWRFFMEDIARQRRASSDNVYLDASLIAGRVRDLLKLIQATDIDKSEDDRAILTDFLYRNPNLVVLDYEQKMFGKNFDGPHSTKNRACNDGVATTARRLAERPSSKTSALFMFGSRPLGCDTKEMAPEPVYPSWDAGGIKIKPVLEHIDRVAEKKESIALSSYYDDRTNYQQGPELPYFVDIKGVWTSRLIRERTDENTLKWRAKPSEALFRLAHKILMKTGEETKRWDTLNRVVRSGGFPYWAWFGNYKACSYHNYGNESIPLLTTSAMADCDHAFPVPNYMMIIDSQRNANHWYGIFRETAANYPWEKKKRQVVWRGALSEADWRVALTSVRWRAAKFVHEKKSDLYDVGLTGILNDLTQQKEFDVSQVGGLVEPITPMADFQKYMAILDLDGSRFSTLLCYNSVVMKAQSRYQEYFVSDLKPWTHYIPVKDDLSDLHQNVEWALDPKNEQTVKNMVALANQWCSERLTAEGLAHDLLDIWEAYIRYLYRADFKWSKVWNSKKSEILASTSKLDFFRLKPV